MFNNVLVAFVVNFGEVVWMSWPLVRVVWTNRGCLLSGQVYTRYRKPRQIGVTEKMPPLLLPSGYCGLTSCPYIRKRMKTQMAESASQTLWTPLDK